MKCEVGQELGGPWGSVVIDDVNEKNVYFFTVIRGKQRGGLKFTSRVVFERRCEELELTPKGAA